MMAALTIFWGLLKGIPWQAWAIGAAVLAAGIWIHHYGATRYDQGRTDEIERAAKAQQRADAIATAALVIEAAHAKSNRDRADAMLDMQAKDNATALAALKGSMPSYVTPQAAARVPDLPLGFLRYGAAAAAWANSSGPDPRGAAVEPSDESSGVSITAYWPTVAEQAGAFRACTEWGAGWRDYAQRVKAQCEREITILRGASP